MSAPNEPIRKNMSFFTRTLHRLRRGEGGFSLLETVVALGILFISLLVLARTGAVGFSDIALSRQRTQANQIANKILEQVRGLSYERVGKGLKTSEMGTDTNIVSCPDGFSYYLVCPTTDPNAEKIVQSATPGDDVPLVPHVQTFGAPDYTTTYTASIYVTVAKLVPVTGAFRVTALVSWNPVRAGVKNSVTTQSLLYTPEGTTDSTTGGGTSPFFYGTGSIGRAPVTMTPNPGVAGGTGLQGLPPWDSMTVNLYGLEASVQQQALARTESKVVLTGASKVVGGVETLAGGDAAEAIADNDPATVPTTSSAPGNLMQETVTSEISGGGNSVEVEAASGGGGTSCPSTQPSTTWMSGFEHGQKRSLHSTSGSLFFGGTGATTVDSTVKRSGNYSLKAAPAGAAAYEYYIGPTTNYVSVLHFAIRLGSLPPADVIELFKERYSSETTYAVAFGYQQSTNKFTVRLRNGSGVWQAPVTSANTVTAGQWYSIDLKYDSSGTTHTAAWQVDGVAQTQAALSGAAANLHYRYQFGTEVASTFTANYDDIVISYTAADYPIMDGAIKGLVPDGMGTSNIGSAIKNETGGTADLSTWWQKVDEVPLTTTDYIKQTSASTTSYAEFTLQDTTDTCIRGVVANVFSKSIADTKTNNGAIHMVHNAVDTVVFNGNLGPNLGASGTINGMGSVVPSQGTTWTQSELNGAKIRLGYSNDVSPVPEFHGAVVQYRVPNSGEETEGGAGTETGSTAGTTAASAGTPCGSPTQIDGRACSYAKEDYSTSGPPHLSLKAGVTGSDSLMARLYRFTPSTAAGSTSYVWGRRAAGGGGVGTVKETVVRYPGTHTFAPIMSFVGSAPAGWLGYWLKYDAGTSPSSVFAEAGIGSSPPSFTSAGTISYWNGTGYLSMAPPTAGGAIPLTPVDFTAGGYRTEIAGSLATSPSFTSQVPAGAAGTADRNEARATLGAPVTGTFTYKVTWVASGEPVADFTFSVDLGALTATARYAP